MFMHLASLAFHYGPEVAETRKNVLWFQELGGKAVSSLCSATKFVKDFFQNMWICETKAFIKNAIKRKSTGFAKGLSETDESILVEIECKCHIMTTWAI